jgi:predicted metal-dependent phosphoesterase TrpH
MTNDRLIYHNLKSKMVLDLHCHTTYSDGSLSPDQLVKAAAQAGVKVLGITDHDTLSGWPAAFAAANVYGLEIVPGIELSTVQGDRSLHILGFYPDPDLLNQPLTERLAGRKRRAQRILDKLAELGYPLEFPMMGEGIAPGRPHIATAMVQAGYVRSAREAFDRFLGDDQPAYVHYEKFSAMEGIQLLRSCGAVPVWAHPCLFRGGRVETVLPKLVDAGLLGVEVYHPNHSPSEIASLKSQAAQCGLLMTGGSDYHGPGSTTNPSDHRLNMLQLPLDLLDPIKQAAQTQKRTEGGKGSVST